MADPKNASALGNTAVPAHGDHDRVAMLSLRGDGTPDQHNPEIIGDKEFALEATRRQFREQAVSAVDQAARGVAEPGAETVGQDPQIEALQQAHSNAEAQAEGRCRRHRCGPVPRAGDAGAGRRPPRAPTAATARPSADRSARVRCGASGRARLPRLHRSG